MIERGFSLIMPAYNEEPALELAAAQALHAGQAQGMPYELLIVNDASRDRTGAIAEQLRTRHPTIIRVLHNRRNLRLGGAILRGVRAARFDRCLVYYVDSPLSPTQVHRFLEASKQADLVVGYRSKRVGYSGWMQIASRVYWWILRLCFGTRRPDLTWICLYRKSVLRRIRVRFRWVVFFPEVILKTERAGFRVVDVRCDMRPRTHGIATVSRPQVVLRAFWDTIRLWWELRAGPHRWLVPVRREGDAP